MLLYIKNDRYIEVEEAAGLAESRTISGIKRRRAERSGT